MNQSQTKYKAIDGGVLAEDDETEFSGDTLQFAVFYVGKCRYGIDIMRIKRVIPAAPHPVLEVPLSPEVVEGVITLRGVVIPVIDLRRRFEVEIDPSHDRVNKLIIVSVHGHIVSLKVDRVHGELRVPSDSVRPAPAMLDAGAAPSEGLFSGVCNMDDGVVFLLNVERIVQSRRHAA